MVREHPRIPGKGIIQAEFTILEKKAHAIWAAIPGPLEILPQSVYYK
jgi:hypothetical protein